MPHRNSPSSSVLLCSLEQKRWRQADEVLRKYEKTRMPQLCDTSCEKWPHGRGLCAFLLEAEGAAGLLSGAGSVCSVSVPRLGHLQQRVLSRLCWWQWEALYWKDTGAGYCLWSIPCSQHSGSHPRRHIPAYTFTCLIQCLQAFATPDPLRSPPLAQTSEPQAFSPSLLGCSLVP